MRLAFVFGKDLVIEVHVGQIKRNMLRGFFLDSFGKFRITHGRQRNLLYDDRVPADRCGNVFGFDRIFGEQLRDRARDGARVHNHRVHNDIGRQSFQPEVRNFKSAAAFFELDSFNAGRSHIQAYD